MPLADCLPAFGKRRLLAGGKVTQGWRSFVGVCSLTFMDYCSLEFVLPGRPILNRLGYAPALTLIFGRFLRIVTQVVSFETKRSNKCTSVAHNLERIAPKDVCFESLKSGQVLLRWKMLDLSLSIVPKWGKDAVLSSFFGHKWGIQFILCPKK